MLCKQDFPIKLHTKCLFFPFQTCQYSKVFLDTDTRPAGLSPKKMVLWDILSKAAAEGLWLSSFLMEMETNHSEVAQTGAGAHQEDRLVTSKETQAPAMEGDTLLKQQGRTNTQNTKGNICNGESFVFMCVSLHAYSSMQTSCFPITKPGFDKVLPIFCRFVRHV